MDSQPISQTPDYTGQNANYKCPAMRLELIKRLHAATRANADASEQGPGRGFIRPVKEGVFRRRASPAPADKCGIAPLPRANQGQSHQTAAKQGQCGRFRCRAGGAVAHELVGELLAHIAQAGAYRIMVHYGGGCRSYRTPRSLRQRSIPNSKWQDLGVAKVAVNPAVLEWAMTRSGEASVLKRKFAGLEKWLAGKDLPSLTQLEKFASASRVPVGFLFMSEPPEEKLPIVDLRTPQSRGVLAASPDLLDTIYLCQRRQDWFHEYAEEEGEEPRKFIASLTTHEDPTVAAARIRQTLGFSIEDQKRCANWSEAMRLLAERAEDAGVLVMVSGVVGNNNRRRLDPGEFRGFALADKLAPLVFINGADAKAAQMFTLAHELAHLWLGESAVSDADMAVSPHAPLENWCNRVAAEFLVPLEALLRELHAFGDPLSAVSPLGRIFKVSTLVILRRLLDAGRINRTQFSERYDSERRQFKTAARSAGGDFYRTQGVRLSRRFAAAVVASTLEGRTLYRDAFQMLGVKKVQTFRELGRQLGVAD